VNRKDMWWLDVTYEVDKPVQYLMVVDNRDISIDHEEKEL
jgi:hypothetical protein